MGPFRPGMGPLWLKKVLFSVFLFIDNSSPFEKIVGQIHLVFNFGWGVPQGPWELAPLPPKQKSCDCPCNYLVKFYHSNIGSLVVCLSHGTALLVHSPVSPNSGSRIWCKILKNLSNGMSDSCEITSYLASHWSHFSRMLCHILKPEFCEIQLTSGW